MTGIVVGTINVLFLHWWHIGIIMFIMVWLIQGTQPQFKEYADKRNKENAKYNEAEDYVQSLLDHTKENKLEQQPKEIYTRNSPKCPHCKSHDIQILDNRRKAFPKEKATAGGVLLGGIGIVAGFAGKRGKKYDAVCIKCGKKFKIKL